MQQDSQVDTRQLVSIAIPFYGSYGAYFEECLRSIVAQTYTHWETVVVDDASGNDIAATLIEQIGDARIRLLRHSRNRGQAAGRNTAIRHSRGPLVMPVDCDDTLAPMHIEELVRALQLHPECGAAYADFELFGAMSGTLSFPMSDTRCLLKEQWIPHPGTIVRRQLWEKVGGYCEDEAFRAGNEDWEYFLRLAEIGLEVIRVPKPLYRYRQHAGSITSSQFARADYRMRELMYERHRDLFDGFDMRRPFLAGGYRASGREFWRKGDRLRAMALLARAMWLAPRDFAGTVISRLRGRGGRAILTASA
jgi:glycosyltransferase involved in cell wall biosynthesis